MADDIVSRISHLKITAEEGKVVALDDVIEDDLTAESNLALVRKVLTIRTYNFAALNRTMNQIWALSKGALFRAIENGLFVVQFANVRDKEKVLSGRPWTFDQNLVMLNDIDGEQQPSSIAMTMCPFWIRLYNLPMGCRSEKHIRLVAGGVGDVVEVDSDGVVWDTSTRVRVVVDISKPLRRMQTISTSKGPALIEIKYERLPTFCYGCGVIGHIERDCLLSEDEDKPAKNQWGSWLRASPRRGRQRLEDEAKKFLSCARVLSFDSPARGVGNAHLKHSKFVNPVTHGEGAAGSGRSDKRTQVKEVVVTPPLTLDNVAIVNNDELQNGGVQHESRERVTVMAGDPKDDPLESLGAHSGEGYNMISNEAAFDAQTQSTVEASLQMRPTKDVSPSLLQFNAGCVTPKKVRRFKTHSRKKDKDSIIPAHVENCCLNMELEIKSGLKRKQADEMCIDDNVDINEGLKKAKVNGDVEAGSAGALVKAVVGEVQPRPAL